MFQYLNTEYTTAVSQTSEVENINYKYGTQILKQMMQYYYDMEILQTVVLTED